MALAFSPGGFFLASTSTNGDIRLWDSAYGHGRHLHHEINGHDLGVTCCGFSPTYGSAGLIFRFFSKNRKAIKNTMYVLI